MSDYFLRISSASGITRSAECEHLLRLLTHSVTPLEGKSVPMYMPTSNGKGAVFTISWLTLSIFT